jgi:hypothetical protein
MVREKLMKRLGLIGAMVSGAVLWASPSTASPPTSWDGLVQVKSKRLDVVYLQPGADFRGYSKVMLDPTEVAFQKNWQKDYNRTAIGLGGRVSDQEIARAVTTGIAAANSIFAKAWQDGGYSVVAEPGPDVLRVRTAVLNINVTSPEVRTSARSFTFSDDAGSAVLVVEVRDSVTNALLGRAVDGEVAGDTTVGWRSSVSNAGDFRALVEDWARTSVKGLAELKSLSPIP